MSIEQIKRIDQLSYGAIVKLKFGGAGVDSIERHQFLGITGEGDKRTARFLDLGINASFEWDVYRFNGRWVYGTSADPVSLFEVEARSAKTIRSIRFEQPEGVTIDQIGAALAALGIDRRTVVFN